MMSVTSRKNRKGPPVNGIASQFRKNPEYGQAPSRNSRFRPGFGARNRSSQVIDTAPSTHSNILDDPLMSCSSNRYGNVDRGQMHADSRANSLTAARLDELQTGGGGGPMMMPPGGMMNGGMNGAMNGGMNGGMNGAMNGRHER